MPNVDDVFAILGEQVTFPAIYIHIASIIVFIAYLMRDQIVLRILLAVGDALFILFFLYYRTGPIWESIFWDSIILVANISMIVVLMRERTMVRMDEEERALYSYFDLLTPGEFRRVLSAADWREGDGTTPIIEHGEPVDQLYFLLEGQALVERDGRVIEVGGGVFLGEIAFLLDRPATATVRISNGGRYICWKSNQLQHLLGRNDRIDRVFRSLFNRDLAQKIASG